MRNPAIDAIVVVVVVVVVVFVVAPRSDSRSGLLISGGMCRHGDSSEGLG
jgi:hypothetical protein